MGNAFHEIHVHNDLIPARVINLYPGSLTVATHWHEELELTASLDSRIRIIRGDQQTILKEWDVTLINSMEPHHAAPVEGYKNRAVVVLFNPVFLEDICPNFAHIHFSLERDPQTRQEIKRCLERLFEINDPANQDPYFRMEVNSLLYRIAHLLLTHCQTDKPIPRKPSTMKYQQRYRQIAAYINAHYSEPLTLKDLADQVHVSKEHLCREFKIYMGEGLREHLTNLRLSKAQQDLLETDISLSDIAGKHGFSDLRSYNKAFRKHFGVSPAQYRRQKKMQM